MPIPCRHGTDKCPDHKYITTLESDKARILRGHNKDKKFWRKISVTLILSCLVLTSALILVAVYGPEEGLRMIVDKLPIFGGK